MLVQQDVEEFSIAALGDHIQRGWWAPRYRAAGRQPLHDCRSLAGGKLDHELGMAGVTWIAQDFQES